MAMKRCNWCW